MDTGDSVLVARLAAGDDEALSEVFDRYAPFVYGLARRVTANHAAAEDIVQEVFTNLWRKPDRFDASRGSLRAFLGVQAHRRAVDLVRGNARRTAREERQSDLDPLSRGGGAEDLDKGAVAQIVRQAIARLPTEQRQAVEMAYLEGHTHREVASLLGIPEGTAKSRLRLAQAKLSEWLAPHKLEMV
jgi:RNA polymerase sigma-70 factor (ECF subfamily)